MKPTLCIIGGCNGAGKTTLAKELLVRMGIRRFLNVDEIARGLSPLDPTLSAFRAGRLVIEEARTLLKAASSFAIESTLSGKTHIGLLRDAKERGYRVVLHYVLLDSATQAVERVALRVLHGGHDVPEADVRRRFRRSRAQFTDIYLPLADEWVLWDNSRPPHKRVADSTTHRPEEISTMLDSSNVKEDAPVEPPECVRLGLEASQAATLKWLDFYRRMGIEVTPEMTLAKKQPGVEPPNEALALGMAEKSKEFADKGSELYAKA